MKKTALLMAALFLSMTILAGNALAQTEKETLELDRQEVKLTKEQQKEMDTLYKDLFEKHKQIIEKYVEYGVFSKEIGDKKKAFLEKHYSKLKEDGFIPKWDHKKHMEQDSDEEKDDNES